MAWSTAPTCSQHAVDQVLLFGPDRLGPESGGDAGSRVEVDLGEPALVAPRHCEAVDGPAPVERRADRVVVDVGARRIGDLVEQHAQRVAQVGGDVAQGPVVLLDRSERPVHEHDPLRVPIGEVDRTSGRADVHLHSADGGHAVDVFDLERLQPPSQALEVALGVRCRTTNGSRAAV